ncbi:MAG: TraB/GumN family protein [Flavobacteriales bacterium]
MKALSFSLVFILASFLQLDIDAQLLYRISGNGLKQDSYLFGTIHTMPKEDFEMPTAVLNALKSCQTVALEIDLDMSLTEKIDLAKMSLLPNGGTLKEYMSDSSYNTLKKYCMDSIGWKESKFEQYEHLKPFFFSSLVLQEKIGKQKSFEMEFDKLAKKHNKPLIGLETVMYQMETVDKVSIKDQLQLMDDFSNMSEFDVLFNLYEEENIDGLYNLISKETDMLPEFNHWFLDVRNANWIPIIEKQINQEPTFIAVGAGHLGGTNGVLALLRKQGYTLTGIKLKS